MKKSAIFCLILAIVLSTVSLFSCEQNNTEYTPEEAFYEHHYGAGRVNEEGLNDGVIALLSVCEYFNDKMIETSKKGAKWVYTNSNKYASQNCAFDELLEKKEYGGNCASIANWLSIDLGIMPSGKHFWGDQYDQFHNYEKVKEYLDPVFEIYDFRGQNMTFKTLDNKGLVEPGDVFLCCGHTFVVRADKTFYASGHDSKWHSDSSAPTEDGAHAVFDNWVNEYESCSNYNHGVNFLLRLKDNYVPQFYRDENGNLVQNPLWDESKVLPYVEDDSYGTDTSGRKNVLWKADILEKNSFNLSKIKGGDNITNNYLYYSGGSEYYADFTIIGTKSYTNNPDHWFNVKGESSETKDDNYKYLAGFWTDIGKVTTVDSFALYSQAVSSTDGTPIGDIDGFDILVSVDGENWTVAYSIENASCENKWTNVSDERNKTIQGDPQCHYIDAKFTTGAVDARYVMFALTQARCIDKEAAEKYGFKTVTASTNYFRLSELQVFKAQ